MDEFWLFLAALMPMVGVTVIAIACVLTIYLMVHGLISDWRKR